MRVMDLPYWAGSLPANPVTDTLLLLNNTQSIINLISINKQSYDEKNCVIDTPSILYSALGYWAVTFCVRCYSCVEGHGN